jgi:hypothetical protein
MKKVLLKFLREKKEVKSNILFEKKKELQHWEVIIVRGQLVRTN